MIHRSSTVSLIADAAKLNEKKKNLLVNSKLYKISRFNRKFTRFCDRGSFEKCLSSKP
jgi:hypothetical protein